MSHLLAVAPLINTGGTKATDIASGNVNSVINHLLSSTLSVAYTVAGIIAVVFVIVGGLKLITSQGSPDKLKSAKTTITYAILGLVITICAYAITSFITSAITGP